MQTAEHHREQFELAYATAWAKDRYGDETPEQLAAEVKSWRIGDTYGEDLPRLRFGWEGYQWARASQCLAQIEEPAQPVAPQGVPVGEIVLSGGDLKEVSWAGGKMPLPGTKLYAEQPVAAAGPAPATFMTDDQAFEWAWNKVREDLGTKGWTAGDFGNFHGFFLHGWNYRGQYELQRSTAMAALKQELMTAAPALEAPAAPTLDAKAIAEVVCQRVAELPDRNSPEDWPEAMLVTGKELIDAVECEITQALDELAAAPQAPAQEAPAAPGVPAGFALVPIEPTQQMLDAGRWSGAGSVSIQEEWARKEVWSRMLATVAPPPAAYADDLVALVVNLVQALSAAAPDNALASHALDYLKRNGLQGSPLQAAEAAPQAPAAPSVYSDDMLAALHQWRQRCEVMGAPHLLPDSHLLDLEEAGLLHKVRGGHVMTTAGRAALAAPAAPAVDASPLIARNLAEWHEDDGDVAWWAWCGHGWAGEPAWIGRPTDDGWPGYHTHWTAHPAMPAAIAAQAKEGGEA